MHISDSIILNSNIKLSQINLFLNSQLFDIICEWIHFWSDFQPLLENTTILLRLFAIYVWKK